MPEARLQVLVTSPERVLFDGVAWQVQASGEQGTLEILPFHRPLMSRLLKGTVVVDGKAFAIRRGIIHVVQDMVTAVVELPAR